MLKQKLALMAAVMGTAFPLAACGGTTVIQAPSTTTVASIGGDFASSFMKGCSGHTTTVVCGCMLRQIEANVPAATILSYVPGSKPQWLLDAAVICTGGGGQ